MVRNTRLVLSDKDFLKFDLGLVGVLLAYILQLHSLNYYAGMLMYAFAGAALLLFLTSALQNGNKNGRALASLFRFSAKLLTVVGVYWLILFFAPVL
ncbi:MAG: hypothetical protein KGL95_01130 [Patescibacteria group bacterium]|nr:hypothetical protein [Patescibacteria group bacterium]